MSMLPEFKLREDKRWLARVVQTTLQLRKHVLKSLGKYLASSFLQEITVARQPVNCTRFLFNDHFRY